MIGREFLCVVHVLVDCISNTSLSALHLPELTFQQIGTIRLYKLFRVQGIYISSVKIYIICFCGSCHLMTNKLVTRYIKADNTTN
ncbi:hypothetical protein Leryth_026719 [Lithospermum erythrorhizon]|nr:hypothetical protein Leryth_026719 [Lithospermum erythrorhizon]